MFNYKLQCTIFLNFINKSFIYIYIYDRNSNLYSYTRFTNIKCSIISCNAQFFKIVLINKSFFLYIYMIEILI